MREEVAALSKPDLAGIAGHGTIRNNFCAVDFFGAEGFFAEGFGLAAALAGLALEGFAAAGCAARRAAQRGSSGTGAAFALAMARPATSLTIHSKLSLPTELISASGTGFMKSMA